MMLELETTKEQLETTKEQLVKQEEMIRAYEQQIQQMSLVERKDAETQFNYLVPMSGKYHAPFN